MKYSNSATSTFITYAAGILAAAATVFTVPNMFELKAAEPVATSASERAVEAVVANGGTLTCFDGENSVTYNRAEATRDHAILLKAVSQSHWRCAKMAATNG